MRDNTNLNKFAMIKRIIIYSIMILIGIGQLVLTTFVALGMLNIVSLSFEIPDNLNWFHVILSLIVALAFILLPIKNIVGYIKRFKNKDFKKEVGTVTIASLESSVNSVDVVNKHNEEIEKTGKTNQTNTVYNNSLVIFLGVIIALFLSVAIFLLVLSFTPNSNFQIISNGQPSDGKDLWKVSLGIVVFLLPVILWFINLLMRRYAIIHNKPIKNIPFIEMLLGVIVAGVLFVFPILFAGEESGFKGIPAKVYFYFTGALFTLILFGYTLAVVQHIKEKRILEGKVPSIRCKAKYMGCRFSSSTSTAVNGVPCDLNVNFKVKFAYTDKFGNEIIKTSNKDYRYDEVKYLKYKHQFDIIVYKKSAIIVEDLSNTSVPDKINVTVDQDETRSNLPYFAKSNRWQRTLIMGCIACAVLEILGILMLVNAKGNSPAGVMCVTIGVLELIYVLFYSLPNVLAEKYGAQTKGKLIKLQVDHKRGTDHDNNRKYAVVEYSGEIKNIYILYDEIYSMLGNYVGQEIPLKVHGKTCIIDVKRLYSDKII